MLVKWINCSVEEGKNQEFSEAQQHWNALENVDGFLGQSGGWDTNDSQEAYIISLWEDWECYKIFMTQIHDKIFRENTQGEMNFSMAISLFEILVEFPGSCETLPEGLPKSSLIRITDCSLNRNREDHFMKMQREIWAPQIQKSKGMFCGVFGRQRGMQDRYLALSFWEDDLAHDRYAKEVFPTLIHGKELSKDIESSTDKLVRLENLWVVSPQSCLVT